MAKRDTLKRAHRIFETSVGPRSIGTIETLTAGPWAVSSLVSSPASSSSSSSSVVEWSEKVWTSLSVFNTSSRDVVSILANLSSFLFAIQPLDPGWTWCEIEAKGLSPKLDNSKRVQLLRYPRNLELTLSLDSVLVDDGGVALVRESRRWQTLKIEKATWISLDFNVVVAP